MKLVEELHARFGNLTSEVTEPRVYGLKRSQTHIEPLMAWEYTTAEGIPFHIVRIEAHQGGITEDANSNIFGLLLCANGWASRTSGENGINPSASDDRQRVTMTAVCMGHENVVGVPFLWETITQVEGDEPVLLSETPKGRMADEFHAYLEACQLESWVWEPTNKEETE